MTTKRQLRAEIEALNGSLTFARRVGEDMLASREARIRDLEAKNEQIRGRLDRAEAGLRSVTVPPGRCCAPSPKLRWNGGEAPTLFCTLRAGHIGAHECENGSSWHEITEEGRPTPCPAKHCIGANGHSGQHWNNTGHLWAAP